jgi:hypothetical protein
MAKNERLFWRAANENEKELNDEYSFYDHQGGFSQLV